MNAEQRQARAKPRRRAAVGPGRGGEAAIVRNGPKHGAGRWRKRAAFNPGGGNQPEPIGSTCLLPEFRPVPMRIQGRFRVVAVVVSERCGVVSERAVVVKFKRAVAVNLAEMRIEGNLLAPELNYIDVGIAAAADVHHRRRHEQHADSSKVGKRRDQTSTLKTRRQLMN